jgi:tripartite-type tricarboxylate transporter receptor subunit TctC
VRGECDGAGLPWDLAEPYIKTREVKLVLAVGKTRFKDYPDVPCVADLGHPELEKVVTNYHIAVGPPGLPKNIETVLSNALYKVVTSDTMKEYQTRAVSRGAVYEALTGDVTRTNVMGCLDLIKSLAPYLK